jgi:hypothetical protein
LAAAVTFFQRFKLEIGAWFGYCPSQSVHGFMDETGADVVMFVGFLIEASHVLAVGFRFGGGVSYRAVVEPETLFSSNTMSGKLRSELELRWSFVRFAYVGVTIGGQMYLAGADYEMSSGLVPAARIGGVFALSLGVDF